MHDNIMLPDGTFLVGSKAPVLLVDGRMTLQGLLQVNPDDYRHQGDTFNVTPERLKMREQHYCMLAERGFECSRWLPINRHSELRPHRQIVARAMAIKAIYCWAADGLDVSALPDDVTEQCDVVRAVVAAKVC